MVPFQIRRILRLLTFPHDHFPARQVHPSAGAQQSHKFGRRKIPEQGLVKIFFFIAEFDASVFPAQQNEVSGIDGDEHHVPEDRNPEDLGAAEKVGQPGRARENRNQPQPENILEHISQEREHKRGVSQQINGNRFHKGNELTPAPDLQANPGESTDGLGRRTLSRPIFSLQTRMASARPFRSFNRLWAESTPA
jgi:hypothetical protein